MSQRDITAGLAAQIQDINGNPALSAQEKSEAIKNLSGAPREVLFEFLNNNFRTGPGLSPFIAKFVSKGRPRGAPSDSALGTLKDKLRKK